MRTGGALKKAGKVFSAMIAGLILTSGAAAAQGLRDVSNDAMNHCGCDSQSGIEMYVGNLIKDARQRGMTAETAKVHASACIAVWCSICSGHQGAVERCVTAAAAYFDAASGIDGGRQMLAFSAK